MYNFLITGCAGFIGSHLCEALLSKGYQVIGIDNFDPLYSKIIKKLNLKNCFSNRNFIFLETDITNEKQLRKITSKIDIVIHIAAKAGVLPSIKNPNDYIHTNIGGTKNILEFMSNNRIKKYIFASSSSIYGNNTKTPFKESFRVDNPISPYAFTKKSCELMNYTYHHLYNIDMINLRFFTVYGPRQRPDLAIHKFVKLILADKPVTLYGNGNTARDYTYIDDIIMGILQSVNYLKSHKNIYEIINLGNGKPITLNKLIDLIHNNLDKKIRINKINKQAGDMDITYASIEKAKRILSYHPNTTFENGIKKYIEWHKENYN